MNLKIKWLSATSVFFFLIAISCGEEEALKQTEDPFGVKVQDGRLVFRDLPHYYATKKILIEESDEFLDKWEQGLGFQSYRKLFHELDNRPELMAQLLDDHYRLRIPSFAYGVVVNRDGEVQIGNRFFKYLRDELVIVSDLKKLKTVSTGEFRNDPSIFVSKVIRHQPGNAEGRAKDWTDDVQHGCSAGGISFTLVHDFETIIDDEGFKDVTLSALAMCQKLEWVGTIFPVPVPVLVTAEVIHLEGTTSTNWGNATVSENSYNSSTCFVLIHSRTLPPNSSVGFTVYSVGYSGYGTVNGVTNSCNFFYTD
jgi:hypothetical protein